jgi:hypothetical protein
MISEKRKDARVFMILLIYSEYKSGKGFFLSRSNSIMYRRHSSDHYRFSAGDLIQLISHFSLHEEELFPAGTVACVIVST